MGSTTSSFAISRLRSSPQIEGAGYFFVVGFDVDVAGGGGGGGGVGTRPFPTSLRVPSGGGGAGLIPSFANLLFDPSLGLDVMATSLLVVCAAAARAVVASPVAAAVVLGRLQLSSSSSAGSSSHLTSSSSSAVEVEAEEGPAARPSVEWESAALEVTSSYFRQHIQPSKREEADDPKDHRA